MLITTLLKNLRLYCGSTKLPMAVTTPPRSHQPVEHSALPALQPKFPGICPARPHLHTSTGTATLSAWRGSAHPFLLCPDKISLITSALQSNAFHKSITTFLLLRLVLSLILEQACHSSGQLISVPTMPGTMLSARLTAVNRGFLPSRSSSSSRNY